MARSRFRAGAAWPVLALCLWASAAVCLEVQGGGTKGASAHRTGNRSPGSKGTAAGASSARNGAGAATDRVEALPKPSPDRTLLLPFDQGFKSCTADAPSHGPEVLKDLDDRLGELEQNLEQSYDKLKTSSGLDAYDDLHTRIQRKRDEIAGELQGTPPPPPGAQQGGGTAGGTDSAPENRGQGTPPPPPGPNLPVVPNLPLVVAVFGLVLGGLAVTKEFLDQTERKDLRARVILCEQTLKVELGKLWEQLNQLDSSARTAQDQTEQKVRRLLSIREERGAGPGETPDRRIQTAPRSPAGAGGATPDSSGGVGYEPLPAPGPDDDSVAPQPAANSYLGLVADLQRLAPPASRMMRFDKMVDLLVEAPAPSQPGFRVFKDPTNGEVRALPAIDQPYFRQHLFIFEPLFYVDGANYGPVSLLQHPCLEESGRGYRVVTKGRLQVG